MALLIFPCLIFGACSVHSPKIKASSYTIEIKEMKFQPSDLTVNKGDTVIWINHDMVAHDVTEDPAKAWSSSKLQQGQMWSKVVTENTSYFCSIHVVMKGKLIVR
jgi:plastocyanin